MKKFLNNYLEYIVAFLVPIAIVLLHCMTRDSWLFGDGSILRGDAGRQYIYIYEELWNKVHGGDCSFFSWNAAGGFDFYLNVLYYAISPATIIALLLPKNCLENVIQIMMVLKWALLSFSAVYFFMHTRFNEIKENKKFISLTFGICYALSAFFIDTVALFNWMDTMILFPFLLLMLEKMVKNRKWKCYYLVLTVAMLCNFYIAFPMCIFLLIWFLLQFLIRDDRDKKAWITFLLSSVGAAVTSLGIILPCALNVSERYISAQHNGVSAYIKSILLLPDGFIRKFFAFSLAHETDVLDMRLYMSIGMIVLALLFVFIQVPKKEKYTKIGIATFVILSCGIGLFDFVWHAFSVPHGYAPRYGFVLILVLLIMALDVICHAEQLKIWQCMVALAVGLGMFFYAFFTVKVFENTYVYLITLFLFVFYFILLVLLCRRSIKMKSFILVFLSLCIIEMCSNAYYQFSEYNMVKPLEMECLGEAVELAKEIKPEAGERVLFDHSEYNTGLKTEISTISGFISYANGKMGNLLYKMGMNILQDAGFVYAGGSPLENMMLNVSYGVGKYEAEFQNSTLFKEGEELDIYKMNQTAGLGYMVEDSVEKWQIQDVSPFELQNGFVENATSIKNSALFNSFLPKDIKAKTMIGELDMADGLAEDNVFAYQYVSVMPEDGIVLEFVADKDMNLYATLRNSAAVRVCALIDDEIVYETPRYMAQIMIPIGDVKKGQTVKVVCGFENRVGKLIQISGQFAEWHEDIWQEAAKELSDEVYKIDTFESDYISGTIESKEDGIMMTSIPAMKGFTVYVDGSKSDYKEIGGALIGVPLKAGKHVVEFRYRTPYAVLGWLISIFSLGIFAIICIRGRKKNVSVFCEES